MISEYIFKGSEPSLLPKVILPTLDNLGIDREKVRLCIPTDLDKNGRRRDTYLILCEAELTVISGIVANNRGNREYKLSEAEVYDIKSVSDLKLCENVSSLYIECKDRSGEYKVIANGSLSRRYELGCAVKYLKAVSSGNEIKYENEDESGENYCPKCGKRYSDPVNKICTECLDRKKILSRTWQLMKKYKGKIFSVVAMLVITSALGVITPYFSASFFYNEVLKPEGSFFGEVLLVVGIVAGTRLLSTVISSIHSIVSSVVAAELSYDLKKTIFSSIQRLSVSFFTSRRTGGLMTQVSEDSTTIYWFFCEALPYFLVNAVQIIAVAVIMFIMDPLLALVSLITFPTAFLAVKALFGKMKIFHNRRFTRQRSMNSALSDILTGVRVVKAFAKEQDETKRFNARSKEAARADKRAKDFATTSFPAVHIILYLSNIIVWAVGGVMILSGSETLNYGILATFIAYMGMVYSPMFQLVDMISQTSDSMNAMGRLCEVMDAESDVKEPEKPVGIPDFKGSIEFKNVDFSYDVGRKVINDVSFKVEAGKSLGIVGHTGAGKSTIANLIIRLYDAERGGIYLDGINVKDIKSEELHKNISIVSQETYIFIGTVFENIAYSNPDATPDEVIFAAHAAGAHEFISKLPEGYETKIGMGYMDLSGGERQRISIARAILKNPSILIMDEATAAMDTETERNIQSALEKLTKGRTTVIIAHRLSTLRDVDSLVVIENGKITESGTHGELIRQKGGYYNLYKLQIDSMKNIGITEN